MARSSWPRAQLVHACACIRDLRRPAGVANAPFSGRPSDFSRASALLRKLSPGTRSVAKCRDLAPISTESSNILMHFIFFSADPALPCIFENPAEASRSCRNSHCACPARHRSLEYFAPAAVRHNSAMRRRAFCQCRRKRCAGLPPSLPIALCPVSPPGSANGFRELRSVPYSVAWIVRAFPTRVVRTCLVLVGQFGPAMRLLLQAGLCSRLARRFDFSMPNSLIRYA